MTTIKLNAIEKRDLIIELAHITSTLYIQTQFMDPQKSRTDILFNLAKTHTIESIIRMVCNIGYIYTDFKPFEDDIDTWYEGSKAGYEVIKNVLYNKFGIRIDD